MAAVTIYSDFGAPQNKVSHCCHYFPIYLPWSDELTHWKKPWCWKELGAGGEGDDRGWDDWMASSTRWAWVWVNSRSCWWTGRPGVLWFMGSQRVGHDWATELNWTELNWTELMGPDAIILVFWMLSFKPAFSLSSFTFHREVFSSSSLSAIKVVSSAYLKLLIFLLAILIPVCASSSPAFLMMYFAYKLNKQGDNTQPWCTPFPILNQSVVPCLFLTVASWPAHRFLRRQVSWSCIPISWRIFHSLLWSIQSKALA